MTEKEIKERFENLEKQLRDLENTTRANAGTFAGAVAKQNARIENLERKITELEKRFPATPDEPVPSAGTAIIINK